MCSSDLYGHEAGWEFWFGKAVRKPVPNWMHGILQTLLGQFLYEAGYKAGSEIDLRARPDWRPRPDVSAVLKLEGSYPSRLDIAVEILSDDSASYIREKCLRYSEVGIPQIFIFDPKQRTIQIWNHSTNSFETITDLHLNNGAAISGERIWTEFEKRLRDPGA